MTNTSHSEEAPHPGQDSIPTRESLLDRLKDFGDDRSWGDFYDTYHRLIYAVALRAGLSESEAQDAIQETFISVAKKMDGFRIDKNKSFKAWLMVITRRRIADQYRRRPKLIQVNHRNPENSSRTSILEQIPDPEGLGIDALWETEWKKNIFDLAVQRVKQKTGSKDFFLFHQQVIKGWTPQTVAKELGVSTAHAYVAKYRISRLIKKEVLSLEKRVARNEYRP